ncbi:protein-(glutamine-N5) methyltransferase, release factor-specific [Candidatus Uhrbacteria bacterium RIFOXYB12_FULL_58_10]|uniref:peptide chain release factor N(5)-glutamine methyltransferase n=1 Tax=Candidatus Uhrbacteria bacterium RIFOXYB2_FULL_57_15 TaxID=1802422 RepID=A0A1F7W7W3_9BACT|nr:MAG: protein-(glutamine-N5) methyltransferase, release factor-specific [Candidatus Uhrbacteria bacterium RIFOXYB12_FULL_58_10]OGL98893.1 MAG: protein-(glutamine-N5) methyltransferase, release factor-specific [Candidatus Uhrbacteria bacterium RIFOXYB2_FULL_57_15]
MLVMEALQWANDALKRHIDKTDDGGRLDSPMLDAEVLLAAVLNANKPWLFTHLDHRLTAEQEERFHEHVKRRTTHEPVAYIIGYREFFKRRFQVNRFVLIPRPATEVLVERALAAADGPERDHTVFADVGTGSGAIAVTLAAESQLPVFATDTSKQALAVAKANAEEHHVEELVDLKHGDLIEPIVRIFKSVAATHPQTFRHLVLCANLPYLTDFQVDTGQRDVRDFEPREALVAGRDGLDAYWNLFRQLKRHRGVLPKRLTALIEIDPSQRQSIVDLIRHDFPAAKPHIENDLEGFARVVLTAL